ncbi:MAG: ferritin-like domain-containing protein [Steroidobacteraceae bacterium]
MNTLAADEAPPLPWSMEVIRYDRIDPQRLVGEETLLRLVACASFIEITSDLYTANLAEYFRDDPPVVDWLRHHWEPEELQHGAALRRYVQTAWPQFAWERAYQGFYAEYSQCCQLERLAPTRALEMVARCVIETGTSSFYRFLADSAPEPVLRDITGRIAADEVRHYKNFYHFFRRYRQREHPGRAAVMRTLWSRAHEIDAEDGYIAFKHVLRVSHPDQPFERRQYEEFLHSIREQVRAHFPYRMALKMFLKPLDLPPVMGRVILGSASVATRMLLR